MQRLDSRASSTPEEVPTNMANNAATMTAETDTIGPAVLADDPVRPSWLTALHDLRNAPKRSVRSYLQQLPEPAPDAPEAPLIETDTAPGFSALNQMIVGRGPIAAMDVDPRDGLIYVANSADDSVAILDPAQLAVITTVTGTEEPFSLAVINGRACVSTVNGSHDAVAVIDRAAEEAVTHPLAMSVRDIAGSPDGRYVYAARTGRTGADIAVIDTATGHVVSIDLRTRAGANAEAIAVSADGSRAYVVTADHLGGEFIAIDTETRRVVGGLAFPAPLRDVAVGPDGTIYVAGCEPDGIIDVVDARTLRVIDTIEIGGTLTQLVISAAGDRLYVVNGDRVLVLCAATYEIVDTITVVAEPSCVAESADGKRLFIADYSGGVTALTVASTTGSLLAKMTASDVLDVAMLELESTPV